MFKRHETYMIEQTQLYEPIKQFTGESLSRRIYFGIVSQLESISLKVQRLFGIQGVGQASIFDLGMGL